MKNLKLLFSALTVAWGNIRLNKGSFNRHYNADNVC